MLSKMLNMVYFVTITPRGIRIPVTSVKGRCPRPLDDGGFFQRFLLYYFNRDLSIMSRFFRKKIKKNNRKILLIKNFRYFILGFGKI